MFDDSGNRMLLGWVSAIFYLAGFVSLALIPFFDWVNLLDATCVFVIAACIHAVYRHEEISVMHNRLHGYTMEHMSNLGVRDVIQALYSTPSSVGGNHAGSVGILLEEVSKTLKEMEQSSSHMREEIRDLQRTVESQNRNSSYSGF